MLSPTDVNRAIKRILTPVFLENGFSKVQTRNVWGYNNECIWVLQVGLVGSSFSSITGWPSYSLTVNLGILYNFLPYSPKIKQNIKGELLPKESECHRRSSLLCSLDQSIFTKKLDNPAERKRKDIWWVESDGSNVEMVLEDIKKSFLTQGKLWFSKNTNKELALKEVGQGKQLIETDSEVYLVNYLGL